MGVVFFFFLTVLGILLIYKFISRVVLSFVVAHGLKGPGGLWGLVSDQD